MKKRTTATNWRILFRDRTGAMLELDYVCPCCGCDVSHLLFVNAGIMDQIEGTWETDQVCPICNKAAVVQCS